MPVYYNSHGKWTTLGRVRKLESERGNRFPTLEYPDDTPAIWVTKTKRAALRYLEAADEWDRLNGNAPLTKEDETLMAEVYPISPRAQDTIVFDDDDNGYLLVRPKARIQA